MSASFPQVQAQPPDWPPTTIDAENRIVLFAIQALLGLISQDMIAISVEISKEQVRLNYWIRRFNDEILEDVKDAAAEMEAFFTGEPPNIATKIRMGVPESGWKDWAGRMVYWAKESR